MEEEEEIIKRLENTEFNNEAEDFKMGKENKRKENAPKRRIIIILGSILLLVGLMIILLLSGIFSNDTKNKLPGIEKTEEEKELLEEGFYKTNHGSLYLDKYIYDNERKILMNLSLKELAKTEDDFKFVRYENNLYIISIYKDKFNLKKVDNDTIISVFEKDYSMDKFPVLIKNGEDTLGIYENSKNKIYLFQKDSYQEESIKNIEIYISENNSVNLYDGNYFMTVNEAKQGKKYGLYDISSHKEVLEPIYDSLFYLEARKYMAIKDGKIGVIDINSKILSDYENISNPSEKSYSSTYFAGKTIIRMKGDKSYSCFYFNEKFVPWVENIYHDDIIGNYFISQNDSEATSFSIYNTVMEKIQDINTSKQNNKVIGSFLDNILVLKNQDGYLFYDITTGESLGNLNTFQKDIGKYQLKFLLGKNGRGTLSILNEEKELGKLENASFDGFISTGVNNFVMKDDLVVYHTDSSDNQGDILLLKNK